MEELLTAQEGDSQGQVESEDADGQSDKESVDTDGQSADSETQTGEEPTGAEGLPGTDMTPEKLLASYKSLQTELGKRTESMKELQSKFNTFEKYGGIDNVIKWTQSLSENPRFAEWIKAEQNRDSLGFDESELDDETKKAISLVEKIADMRIGEVLKNKVEPLAESYKQKILQENLSALEKKYPDWREVQTTMYEIAQKMPASVQDNPSLEDLEDLYWKALRHSNKLEEMQVRSYKKKLEAIKKSSTDKPAVAGEGKSLDANTMAEAFAAAKRATK